MADDILDARAAALARLLDDASMFAADRPALEDAAARHGVRATGAVGWLVHRLLVPAQDAPQLVDVVDGAQPPAVAVVLSRTGAAAFGASIGADLERLVPLTTGGAVHLDGIEVTLAGSRPGDDVVRVLGAAAEVGLPAHVALAVDVAAADRPAGEVLRLVEALAAAAGSDDAAGRAVVARVRVQGTPGGGPPDDTELAGLLTACADRRLPVVVGPGIATPVRGAAADAGHGVLNVVGAAVLAYLGKPLAVVRGALAARGEGVRLGSGALVVGEEVADSEHITACRRDFLRSVGVVDVAAHIAALRALGALGDEGGAR